MHCIAYQSEHVLCAKNLGIHIKHAYPGKKKVKKKRKIEGHYYKWSQILVKFVDTQHIKNINATL